MKNVIYRILLGMAFGGLLAVMSSSCAYSHVEPLAEDNNLVHLDLNIKVIGDEVVSELSGQLTCIRTKVVPPDVSAAFVDRTIRIPLVLKKNNGKTYVASPVISKAYLLGEAEGQVLLALTVEYEDGAVFSPWTDLTAAVADALRGSDLVHIVLALEVVRDEKTGVVIRLTGWQPGGDGGTVVRP